MEELLNKRNIIIGTIISLIIGGLSYTYIKNRNSNLLLNDIDNNSKLEKILLN